MAVPSDIAGLHAWYKADAITGLSDGALLSVWPDSSGNGYPTEQPTSLKPTYETSELNSLPVVRFGSGGDKALRSNASSSLPDVTIFAVLKFSGVTGTQIIRGTDVGALTLRVETSKFQLLKSGVAVIGTGATTLVASTWYVVCGTFSAASSWAIYVNGGVDGSGSTTQTLSTGGISPIGGSSLFGGSALLADMAELFWFNSVLSTTDRGSMTDYLNTKYALSGPAPAFASPADTRRQRIRPLLVR